MVVMFVEALVVLIRHHNHIRVTRAVRPLFFVDSYLMCETRRYRFLYVEISVDE